MCVCDLETFQTAMQRQQDMQPRAGGHLRLHIANNGVKFGDELAKLVKGKVLEKIGIHGNASLEAMFRRRGCEWASHLVMCIQQAVRRSLLFSLYLS